MSIILVCKELNEIGRARILQESTAGYRCRHGFYLGGKRSSHMVYTFFYSPMFSILQESPLPWWLIHYCWIVSFRCTPWFYLHRCFNFSLTEHHITDNQYVMEGLSLTQTGPSLLRFRHLLHIGLLTVVLFAFFVVITAPLHFLSLALVIGQIRYWVLDYTLSNGLAYFVNYNLHVCIMFSIFSQWVIQPHLHVGFFQSGGGADWKA